MAAFSAAILASTAAISRGHGLELVLEEQALAVAFLKFEQFPDADGGHVPPNVRGALARSMKPCAESDIFAENMAKITF
ncbi:MAG: hypothetical protein WDM96_11160 [Lacunisphaera sp.]